MSNNISIKNIDPQEIIINGQGSGGGITTVYVNGVDVTIGSKAYVIVPTKTSELTNDSGFITNAEETDPTVPYYVKEITMADINSWNDKQDLLVSGTTIKTINGESVLGSGNISVNPGYTAGTGIDISGNVISNTITSYNDLTDLPTIPTKTSELVNDSGYITNTVDDLTNYLNTDFLNKLLPKSEDSGTELYLEDTADLPLRLDLNPSEITQHTTTGKNLLNPVGTSTTLNGITFTNNGDGTFTANGTASANTSFDLTDLTNYPITLEANTYYTQTLYIISGTFGGGIVPAFKNSGGVITYNFFRSNANDLVNTQRPTDTMTGYAYTYYIGNGGSVTDCTFKVQLEKGSTSTDWEEYTGGVASPNPDYPQDLHTINGENVITVMGKNLFVPTLQVEGTNIVMANGTVTLNEDEFELSATGSDCYFGQVLAASGTYTNNRGVLIDVEGVDNITFSLTNSDLNNHFITAYDSNKISLGYTQFSGVSSGTYSIPSGAKYISLRFGKSNAVPGTTYKTKVQIEVGSTATAYAPFESKSYPIELSYVYNADTGTTEDFDLCKITTDNGEYETFFFKNYKDSKYYNSSAPENTIYYNKGVYKYICNPDDDWVFAEDGSNGYLAFINLNDMWAGTLSQFKLYSNYFLDITKKDPNSYTCANAWGNTIYIQLDYNLNISTIEDWKDFITNNEVIFYIARQGRTIDQQRVSTIEKYTDLASQYHDVMDNAMCSDGATNVVQTNNDLPFDLKGSSYKKIS